jgi:hypothetical protein
MRQRNQRFRTEHRRFAKAPLALLLRIDNREKRSGLNDYVGAVRQLGGDASRSIIPGDTLW